MVRNREEAAKSAELQRTNKPGTCQLWTRTRFDAPSAGDRDGDRDADAVDGWKSEPLSKKHYDRNPPRGVPVAFSGGSRGFGHRAVSLGGGRIRSTDMYNNRYKAGVVGTTTILDIERSMGVHYLGWSETITGTLIPLPHKPAPVKQIGPKRAPAAWGNFLHLSPGAYMDYWDAIPEAKKLGKGIDIDAQKSKSGTGWGLHWGNVGRNFLKDPKGLIKSTRRIDSLTDAEILRLRGPKGQKVHRISSLLKRAAKFGVRVELEVKVVFAETWVKAIFALAAVKALREKHLLQIKTLAALPGSIQRLTPWQKRGAVTLLSFTGYKGKGISKKTAWPIVDYTRGTTKWVA